MKKIIIATFFSCALFVGGALVILHRPFSFSGIAAACLYNIVTEAIIVAFSRYYKSDKEKTIYKMSDYVLQIARVDIFAVLLLFSFTVLEPSDNPTRAFFLLLSTAAPLYMYTVMAMGIGKRPKTANFLKSSKK